MSITNNIDLRSSGISKKKLSNLELSLLFPSTTFKIIFINSLCELLQIEAAFEQEAVCSLAGDWAEALAVAGFLTDGNIVLDRSKVKIIHTGLQVIKDLASFRLKIDCV